MDGEWLLRDFIELGPLPGLYLAPGCTPGS
jgi:hypothetical protein